MANINFEAQNIDSQLSEVTDGIMATMGHIEDKQPTDTQAAAQDQGDGQDDLDFQDLPNGKIRYEKMKTQKQQFEESNRKLQMELENMKGQLSVLQGKSSEEQEESAEDPTEYMSDVEKLLYKQNLTLQDQIKDITSKFSNIEQKETNRELNAEEAAFFENNPDLAKKREEILESVDEFVKQNPVWGKLLASRQVTVPQICAVATAKNVVGGPTKNVREASTVFGGDRRTPAGNGSQSSGQDDGNALNKIIGTLRNKESTNKREATNAFLDILTEDIARILPQ